MTDQRPGEVCGVVEVRDGQVWTQAHLAVPALTAWYKLCEFDDEGEVTRRPPDGRYKLTRTWHPEDHTDGAHWKHELVRDEATP